jgi:opacity protein-like surface antigen
MLQTATTSHRILTVRSDGGAYDSINCGRQWAPAGYLQSGTADSAASVNDEGASRVKLLLSVANLHKGPVSMRRESSSRIHTDILLLLLATLAPLAQPIADAKAGDLLGLYVGGAIGQSRVEINSEGFALDNFRENHSAFQLMAGVRPISLLGAEIDYIDFGHPGGNLNGAPASATLKGAAAFGVLYLPVPVIDIYAKVGLARLQSSLGGVSAVQPDCVPCAPSLFQLDRTNTHFAAGAGAQYKLGAFALRAEYEYFDAGGANSGLVSLGITWTFL